MKRKNEIFDRTTPSKHKHRTNANKCAHIRFWNRLVKNILIKNSITQLTLESKQIEGCKRDTLCARYVIQNIPHFRVCKNELQRVQTDYSKALRYTASSCTDLDNARFWIGSKKIWDARIYVVKTLNCTVFWCSCLIK